MIQNPHKGGSDSLRPPARRVPINRTIDLRFPTFEGLVTKISSNLSTSGMFVQSSTPAEVGTEFSFRIHIEEWSPIQGRARVIWVRQRSENPERPAGMGVEFVQLDAQSRRMIRWLVDKHLQEGGKPFDLDKLPAGASRSASSRVTSLTNSFASKSRRKTSSVPLILIWLIILGAVAVGTYFWWEGQDPRHPGSSSNNDRIGEPSPDATADASDPEAADIVESDTPRPESDPAGASRVVDSWEAAWEDRRADRLLELYGEEFEAPNGLTRVEWESTIRDRFAQPGFILVAISGLDISFPEVNTAVATFYRSIRSDSGNETGRLQLQLVARDGEWLIVSETEIE